MAAVVQSLGGQSTGAVATLAKTFGSNVTAGNVIVAIVQSDGGKCTGNNIVDTQLNTYSRIVGNGGDVAIFRALNVAAGSTVVTYTPDTPTDYCALTIAEISGLDTAPDDGSNTSTATSLNVSTGTVVTTKSGIVLGVFSRHVNALTDISDAHTDIFNTGNTYSSVNGAAGYWIKSAAGTYDLLWSGASAAYKAAIIALNNAGAADQLGHGRGLSRRLRTQAVKRASHY